MNLSDNILNYLNGRGWTAGGTIERHNFLNKDGVLSKPATVSRILRSLSENGTIKKKLIKGYVWYYYKSVRKFR